MIIPIRCFTCGIPIAHKWETFESLVNTHSQTGADDDDTSEAQSSTTQKKSARLIALETLCIDRMCCRRHFLTNLDIVDKL